MLDAGPTDTRTRLLEHARAVYLEGGAWHFSLREVARRAGVSAPAVYRHFDNKEALLAAVCEQGFHTFSRYLFLALAAPTPLERLRAAGASYCRFALENPHDYRVIFMSTVAEIGLARAAPTPGDGATFQFLVDRVRDCVDSGAFRPGDPREIAPSIWAHVHGLAALRLSGHLDALGSDAAFERFFATSTDHLLRGFAP